MDKDIICDMDGGILAANIIVDIWDLRNSTKNGNPCKDWVAFLSKSKPNGIPNWDEDKMPANAVDYGFGSLAEELVDD